MTEQSTERAARPRLFSGEPVLDYFSRVAQIMPSVAMPAASQPIDWPSGTPIDLPPSYSYLGVDRSTEDLLAETDTAALLVLHEGAIRFERYWHTGGPDVQWLSMSVAKSFVSALVGIAVDDGLIGGLDDPISSYIRVDAGSAYDGVSIRDVLQMSSGARWNEDYSDSSSDVFALTAAFGRGSLDAFVAGAASKAEPGTVCRYNSTDTQALGTLLVAATGRSLADYMTEQLIEPLGMTAPSHWLVDAEGREAAFFGLTMTARDFARLGELYRQAGRCNGRQIVPEHYVADSVRSHLRHTEPGQVWAGDHQFDLGYGYHWWLPDGDPGEFSAIGVYNQFVYVHPSSGVVIVKLSANQAYGTSTADEVNRELENLAMLRAIARSVS
ncbi:MAG: serine hydrolase domain-containing protein [Acidimicrobiales bacterium]